MAESRGSEKGKKVLSFAAKKARRVQQKMLEKVGKTEKTTDDNYTEFVVNFNKQQLAAARLQKELQKYASNMKAMSASTKSLVDVWMEYYEPQWTGQAEVSDIVKNKMLLWEDVMNRVHSDLIETLQLYMSKFPETKKLVEKRERKIVDYDYAKRVLEETRQKQKVTDVKIQQAEEAYQQAKQAFDEVTNSLYEELPALYDSRIEFYAKFFTNMTSIETKFHEEMAKLDSRYNEIMCDLANEAESGKHTSKKDRLTEPESLTPHKNSDEESQETGSVNVDDSSHLGDGVDENCSEGVPSVQGEEPEITTPSRTSSGKESPIRSPPSKPQRTDDTVELLTSHNSSIPDDVVNSTDTHETSPSKEQQPPQKPAKVPLESEEVINAVEVEEEDTGQSNEDETNLNTAENELKPAEDQPLETNGTAAAPPPVIIQKRIATHPYTGEDEDELTFEKGDIILVIPYESQEDEEDEGWNMGIVENTGKRGLFPENFTKLHNEN